MELSSLGFRAWYRSDCCAAACICLLYCTNDLHSQYE